MTPQEKASQYLKTHRLVGQTRGGYVCGCAKCRGRVAALAALIEGEAAAVIADLMTPSEAMLDAAEGALRTHIAALPAEIRAKTKHQGGFVLVGAKEKHAVRLRAMLAAYLFERGEARKALQAAQAEGIAK